MFLHLLFALSRSISCFGPIPALILAAPHKHFVCVYACIFVFIIIELATEWEPFSIIFFVFISFSPEMENFRWKRTSSSTVPAAEIASQWLVVGFLFAFFLLLIWF